jgi:hypothetical protein
MTLRVLIFSTEEKHTFLLFGRVFFGPLEPQNKAISGRAVKETKYGFGKISG